MNKSSFTNHSFDNESNSMYYTPSTGYTCIVMYRKIIRIFLIYGLRTGKIQGGHLESCEHGL